MKQHWKLIKNEKPDYGMNVLIETNDGWMHEAFRNIGNRGDFYRSGKFTIDEKQIFAWRPLPADYHGSVPTNSVDVDSATIQALEARVAWLEGENIAMYGAIIEAADGGSIRCKLELQRIASDDARNPQ